MTQVTQLMSKFQVVYQVRLQLWTSSPPTAALSADVLATLHSDRVRHPRSPSSRSVWRDSVQKYLVTCQTVARQPLITVADCTVQYTRTRVLAGRSFSRDDLWPHYRPRRSRIHGPVTSTYWRAELMAMPTVTFIFLDERQKRWY